MQIFSATIDPVVHLNPHGHVDLYLVGGGGLFRWRQEFTQPSVAIVPVFNPFFGFSSAAVPTTEILSSYSVNRPGFDVGGGIALGARHRGKFFAEARYNHIYKSFACGLHSGDLWFPVVDARRERTTVPEFNSMWSRRRSWRRRTSISAIGNKISSAIIRSEWGYLFRHRQLHRDSVVFSIRVSIRRVVAQNVLLAEIAADLNSNGGQIF